MSLLARVNVSGAVGYASRFAGGEIVTDIEVVLPNAYPAAALAADQAAILGVNAATIIGRYRSSRRARSVMLLFPDEAHPLGSFTAGQYWPDAPLEGTGTYIDYSQPAAQALLVSGLVSTATGRPLLMSDEWAHRYNLGPSFIAFETTLAYMGAATAAVHAAGCPRHYQNVAVTIGVDEVTDPHIAGLGAACDGVLLETVLAEYVATNATRLGRWVANQTTLIAALDDLIYIPLGATEAAYDAEARFYAGLAMVLDGPKVNWPYFREHPTWRLWDETYGVPTGPLEQSGTTLLREFGNYYFTVDCAARTVTIGDTMADLRNTIADRLWVLFEAQPTITAAVLPGNRYKGNESGWLRREIARAPADRRGLEITFARGRHSLYTGRTGFAKEVSGFTTSSTCDFDVSRFHEVVITLREPLPTDPGVHPVQESIEQTLFNAEPQLGLTSLIPPDGLGELTSDERETRQGEFPNPGRITVWRLPITSIQGALALRALTP